VGWTDPEGSREHIGALLLGYYTADGALRYAGRAGTGITDRELKRLSDVLKPLQISKMPLAEPPPGDSRFGSPLKLSRVHWVRPQIVVEVAYLTWTEDNLQIRPLLAMGERVGKAGPDLFRSPMMRCSHAQFTQCQSYGACSARCIEGEGCRNHPQRMFRTDRKSVRLRELEYEAAQSGPLDAAMLSAARTMVPDSTRCCYCTFCGKSQHEVRKLIAGPTVFICDECVGLCNGIIENEGRRNGPGSPLPGH
jgi:hypothetical protein